jgi:hypothetical protein
MADKKVLTRAELKSKAAGIKHRHELKVERLRLQAEVSEQAALELADHEATAKEARELEEALAEEERVRVEAEAALHTVDDPLPSYDRTYPAEVLSDNPMDPEQQSQALPTFSSAYKRQYPAREEREQVPEVPGTQVDNHVAKWVLWFIAAAFAAFVVVYFSTRAR